MHARLLVKHAYKSNGIIRDLELISLICIARPREVRGNQDSISVRYMLKY